MTCIATSQELLPEPQSVTIGNLAMAAGIAGHSVALCYEGFPAPILCELWKHHADSVGAVSVFQVSGQADVRKLSEQVSVLRLVLVHTPRSYNATAWAIQMTPPGDGAVSRPAMFSRSALADPEDDPSASLVLRANAAECDAIRRWLAAGRPADLDWATVASPDAIETAAELLPVVSSNQSSPNHCLPQFRDHQVLSGLLAGACLLRAARQKNPAGMPSTLTLQDYELVRKLLQSPIIGSADHSFDPLAVDMVNRANVFLAIKCESGQEGRTAPSLDGHDVHCQSQRARPPRELITRREVADLGNVRSRIVRRLVEFLQRQANGYEHFRRIGLVRRPPENNAWRSAEIDDLIACIRPWSAKQVRTHFEQLRRAGMITAEREHDNGPWQYELPEELMSRSSVFLGLPSVEDIGHGAQAS